MLNVFKYEFKMMQKSLLVWSISILMILYVMMVFFPVFSHDVALIDNMMANYPPELLKAFGMSSEMSLATVLGYFSFTFAMVQLALSVQAANYGFSILSIEEREFTADFLITKPVSRNQILFAKFITACVILTLTNVITWIGSFTAITWFRDGKPYESDHLVYLLTTIFFFQLFYLAIGMFLSVLMKRVRNVLTFSLSIAFGTYILNALRGIVGGTTLGLLSPFYYFEPSRILSQGHLDLPWVIGSFAASLIMLALTVKFYNKRDIASL